MKFRLITEISRSGNWMVDAPDEIGGDIDWSLHKEEMAEGCHYRKFSSGERWCVYDHSKKQNTTNEDIENAIEGKSNEEINICPGDVEECPIGRWKESDAWTNEDWKSYYEESNKD